MTADKTSGGKLAGKRALITGADGGIGSALTRGLAGHGAAIVLHSLQPGAADELATQLRDSGTETWTVHGDVTNDDDVLRFTDAATADGLPLDILVNNAGRMSTQGFLESDVTDFANVINTNLVGYFRVGQAVCRHMARRGSGAVVNISSTRKVQAWPGSSAYATAKAGVEMLTRSMALELAPLGVRVNSVAPGTFLTNLNSEYLTDPEFRAQRVGRIPIGRLGEVSELVGAVAHLASDEASFTTGASLMVDGGQTLW